MRELGKICTALGVLFVAAALFLFAWNEYENYKAENSADNVMSQIEEETTSRHRVPDPYDTEMTEKEIDGIKYVGYLTIPKLKLNLPIISEWSYPNLKLSPCRYYGSSKTDDLVIAAHNYRCHFGAIGSLEPGDEIALTDMDGVTSVYEVVETEVLNPTAIEDMIAGDYDLTLFTCTYGGKTRITVRCDKIQ